MKWFVAVAALLGCLSTAPAKDAKLPLKLVLAGDSTMCNWPTNVPKRGWGMFLQDYFDDGVKVTNMAASGRSTKTFRKEGRWKKVLEAKPDIILIQFGHNDSHGPGKSESTDAGTDYKTNLCQFIDEARAAGATPILITPMVRRTFGADGQLKDPLQPYAEAMKQVAAEKSVPVVDLHASSKALVQSLGFTESMKMANEDDDYTHFNTAGAKKMAELVMKELPEVSPVLKSHLKTGSAQPSQ